MALNDLDDLDKALDTVERSLELVNDDVDSLFLRTQILIKSKVIWMRIRCPHAAINEIHGLLI